MNSDTQPAPDVAADHPVNSAESDLMAALRSARYTASGLAKLASLISGQQRSYDPSEPDKGVEAALVQLEKDVKANLGPNEQRKLIEALTNSKGIEQVLNAVKEMKAADKGKKQSASVADTKAKGKAPAKGKAAAKAAPAKAPAVKGEITITDDDILKPLVDTNPRQAGSKGHKSMAMFLKHPKGITYKAAKETKQTAYNHVRYDIEKGHLQLIKAKAK